MEIATLVTRDEVINELSESMRRYRHDFDLRLSQYLSEPQNTPDNETHQ